MEHLSTPAYPRTPTRLWTGKVRLLEGQPLTSCAAFLCLFWIQISVYSLFLTSPTCFLDGAKRLIIMGSQLILCLINKHPELILNFAVLQNSIQKIILLKNNFQISKQSLNSNRNFIMRNRIIRLPEVINRTGLSRSTIYEYIKIGIFPRQINLGIRAVGWYEDDIEKWLQLRAGCREGNASTTWLTQIEK